jgi:hypothetical protein
MFLLKKSSIVFALMILVSASASAAKSQADCMYGYRIYIRDNSGKSIANAKVEVFDLSERDRLPAALQNTFINGAYFVGFIMYGCSYPGHFLLRVSADGLQRYERPITFTEGLVACDLTLKPNGSGTNADFEMLATLRGKIVDQNGRPFGGARVEAKDKHGRIHEDFSSEYGLYNFDLPNGLSTIRITGSDIKSIVFENYRIEGRNPSLDVKVCRGCKPSE